jgi:hypothetical protein
MSNVNISESGAGGGGGGGGEAPREASFVQKAADFTHWACFTQEALNDLASTIHTDPDTGKLSCTNKSF